MKNGFAGQVLTGAESMRAGEAIRRAHDAKVAWPYMWENAPPGSEHICAIGSVQTPAQGSAVQVVQYNVKNNYRASLRAILVEYAGGNYNPGDFTWSLTVNAPVNLPLAQGIPWKDYVNVPFNMGSRAGGPWPIMSGELSMFQSRDQIRIVATNVNLGVGSPNFFIACLIGFEWPNA